MMKLKLQRENKQITDIVTNSISEHKQKKFVEASRLFRKRMDEKGISLKELLKTSRKIREEIADEQFK